jgi:selenocysteine-specific elongation factor
MKQIVLGTAGHIDHGKTALIKTLTGIDCDRLKEEKERGITIELGFAYYQIGDDLLIGIVDVPGHERFVKHMVAGAWGIDMVLFVIAADESVMPQTREHLDICELLGIRRGIVVITKKDLADDEMIELVKEEVRELTAGGFLQNSPVVAVSSATGENMDVLREEIRKQANEIRERSREGVFRLPVDRVFTIKGFGTVVTGTCISGSVRLGEEVEIFPGGSHARVRTVQAYHQDVREAGAGQRVALNLQGIEKQELDRGAIIGLPESLLLAHRVDATLRYLKLPFRAIRNNSIMRFHIATTQVEARLVLLDRDVLEPGDSAFVQFVFSEPVVVLPGDRYILRGSYAVQTLGGGTVLDIAPVKHKKNTANLKTIHQLLETGSLKQRAEYHVGKGGAAGIATPFLSAALGLDRKSLDTLLTEMETERIVKKVGKAVVLMQRFEQYKQVIKETLTGFHEKNPLKIGMSKEELRMRLPAVEQQVFQTALDDMTDAGHVEIDKDKVKLKGLSRPVDQSVEKLHAKIVATLHARGFMPPSVSELSEELGIKETGLRDMLQKLAYESQVVRVKSDMYFAGSRIEELKKTVKDHMIAKKEMVPADFKEILGLSRKYLIPLLEYLDEIKLTIRTGDKRVLRNAH